MLLLILKSSTCLAVFILFYKLCLEKTSAHTFKRFYLISATLISIAIPFITFTEYIENEPVNFALDLESQNYSNLEITDITESKNYLPAILWSIYALGAILFSIRFFKNLHQLFKKIKDNPKYKNQHFINVLITDLITPHTFFNYIFLNKTKFENKLIPNEVLLHEQTHAKQMHALDILFIEVLQILFWFNPLLYFIKKDIKLNHEFLADQAVIKHGVDSSIYQKTLLAFSSKASDSSLANAINYSLIKKRFTVMKTKTSKTALWLRSIIILPLLAVLIYGFSQKVVVKKNQNPDENQITETPLEEGEGVTESMLKEYNDFTNQYKQTQNIAYNNHLRIIAIYKMMTKAQRLSVNKPNSKWYNASKLMTVPRHPTQTEFDSWKNSKEFIFFIDGEVIRTDELNNYMPKDIYSYSNRFAIDNDPKNGFYESKRYMLLTEKGFQLSHQDTRAREYNKVFLNYSNEIAHYLNSDRLDNSELKILKAQLDDLYKTLTSEDFKKFNLLKAPEIPNESYKILNNEEILSPKVLEYNVLAKKYNDQNIKNSNRFDYNSKELKRLYFLYKNMTKEQKKNVEPFPYLSNETIKRNIGYAKDETNILENSTKIQQKVTQKKEEYNKLIKTSENHQIKIFINTDREIFVDNIKVDFNYLSQKIIEIKNQLIATKYANERDGFKIKYNLFIKVEIEGHTTEQYLDDLKSEIEKSNLTIYYITADSVSLSKKKNDYGIKKKINIISSQDTIYRYRQTTKITVDTINKGTRNKKS